MPSEISGQDLDYDTLDLNINMGPQHPSTHGVFRMVLTVDGEVIVNVEPVIGYMHRGGEKLLESLDYRQGIGIMDRTDYLGNFNGEHVYCLAAEQLYGFDVPERAEYLRVICTELNRVASHMMFMGAYGTDAVVFGTTFTYGFIERERIQRVFERLTGERMMYNYFRVGGVRYDVRKDEPYSIYDRFDFDVPTGTAGDCYDRYLVRLEEIIQSLRIVEQALEQMPRAGPLMPERYPRMLRLPVGEV